MCGSAKPNSRRCFWCLEADGWRISTASLQGQNWMAFSFHKPGEGLPPEPNSQRRHREFALTPPLPSLPFLLPPNFSLRVTNSSVVFSFFFFFLLIDSLIHCFVFSSNRRRKRRIGTRLDFEE